MGQKWRIEQAKKEPANKFDGQKARFDLLPVDALEEVVKIYTYGAIKYGYRNWEKGLSWSRLFGAMMRHSWAFWRGEDIDSESGLLHIAHATWCGLALIHYSKHRKAFDDRVKIENKKCGLNQ